MSKFKDMTIDDLNAAAEKPKGNLTFGEIFQLAKMAKDLQKINEELQAVQYKKLTFWGKVKSVFSKAPVYKEVNKKEK